ncbi:MAG TPA: ABATE domain-containing protein [Candidatus Limnocylindria bacterium]|jgi:predicted RNA-binding Zn ribbon-like protein|nr:ABATE domain-containing protein [Candidatus Limnocylindria bacterium]
MTQIRDLMPEPPSGDLWVDFVNTLVYTHDEPADRVASAETLVGWLRQQRLLSERAAGAERAALRDEPDEAQRRLERFRALRDLIRNMATEMATGGRPSRPNVRELNHVLRDGLHYHQLEMDDDGSEYGLARVGDRLDQARATIAGTLAEFVATGPVDRLRICANAGCREIFIDRSRTGRRRWCDMRTCGNQAKAARHRARLRVIGTPEPLPAATVGH